MPLFIVAECPASEIMRRSARSFGGENKRRLGHYLSFWWLSKCKCTATPCHVGYLRGTCTRAQALTASPHRDRDLASQNPMDSKVTDRGGSTSPPMQFCRISMGPLAGVAAHRDLPRENINSKLARPPSHSLLLSWITTVLFLLLVSITYFVTLPVRGPTIANARFHFISAAALPGKSTHREENLPPSYSALSIFILVTEFYKPAVDSSTIIPPRDF